MVATPKPLSVVNNAIYHELGDRWYRAADDPVALLRAESRHRNPWIAGTVERAFGPGACEVLDIGCGAGFLSNYLAEHGHQVVGVDVAKDGLAVAARHDTTRSVDYQVADATALPFDDGSFDVVCAMDLLEHVDDPAKVVAEAARVLGSGGLFFFHTFDRNWLSWLVVIKGVEWFVKNTPADMHVLDHFVRPHELGAMCLAHGLEPLELHGSRPRLGRSFFRMLRSGIVDEEFEFTFTRSTLLGYTGVAEKVRPARRPR